MRHQHCDRWRWPRRRVSIPLYLCAGALICLVLSLGEFDQAIGTSNVVPDHDEIWYAVELSDGTGFIDTSGRIVFADRFEDTALVFRGPLLRAKKNGLWGYIDRSGKFAIPPIFQYASDFKEDRAAVSFPGRSGYDGYIDPTGTLVIADMFDVASDFKDGVARVGFATRESVIRQKYAKVGIECTYIYIDREGVRLSRSQELPQWAPVKPFTMFGKTGLADDRGDVVLVPAFDDARLIGDGLAAIKSNGKWGFIRIPDRDPSEMMLAFVHGTLLDTIEWLLEPSVDAILPFDHGVAVAVIDGQYGLVDQQGRWVLPARYEFLAFSMSQGRREFCQNELWGYLDNANAVVIEAQFLQAADFDGPLARVTIEGEVQSLIDTSGRIIWPIGPATN